MELNEGEKEIIESTDGQLTLTNQRVVLNTVKKGILQHSSIPIGKISLISIHTSSSPQFLWIAAILLMVTLAVPSTDSRIAAFIGVVIFYLAYLFTKKGVIEIHSAGGSIAVPTKGMKHHDAMAFTNHIHKQIAGD